MVVGGDNIHRNQLFLFMKMPDGLHQSQPEAINQLWPISDQTQSEMTSTYLDFWYLQILARYGNPPSSWIT